VWAEIGHQEGQEYYTALLVEKALSLDNVFVISLIFSYFAIPQKYQHRVLFWGILGVIVLRGLMIGVGSAILKEYEWILYLFGAFLIFTGIKMLFTGDHQPDMSKNKMLKFFKARMRIVNELHGQRFFVRLPDPNISGKRAIYATPLFVALMMVEAVDLLFAVDSIPAVFAITKDPYIVYTSNIFAILGLRALYFCLSAIVHRFEYLKYGLALVLVFIGSKIFLNDIFGKMPAAVSLGVTLSLLVGSVVISWMKTTRDAAKHNG
jgi:tellurite resistance protein TerC